MRNALRGRGRGRGGARRYEGEGREEERKLLPSTKTSGEEEKVGQGKESGGGIFGSDGLGLYDDKRDARRDEPSLFPTFEAIGRDLSSLSLPTALSSLASFSLASFSLSPDTLALIRPPLQVVDTILGQVVGMGRTIVRLCGCDKRRARRNKRE